MEQFWRFGGFKLDTRNRELLKNSNEKVKLQEQPFQILSALLEHSGEIVTREELRHRVWPANTFVDFDNGLNVAIAKLRNALSDHAEKPHFIETLPRLGYRFVAPAELVSEAPPETPTPVVTRRRWNPFIWGLIPAVLVAGFAVLMIVAKGFTAGNSKVKIRPSVAIMGFRNLTANQDQEWLSTALSEMLATELAAGEHFRIIPGESVARIKLEMGLPDAESYSAQTLAKIRRRLGADYILVGSYLSSGAQSRRLRLDWRLQNSQSGETLAMSSENGGQDDLTGLVAQTGLGLRQRLAMGSVSQAEDNEVRAFLPPTSDSARLYAEGLNRLRHFDASGARDLLGQAVAVDPSYALAHSALSDAWSVLGYAEVARNEAQKAWQLSASLPVADRFAIEGRFRAANSEWAPAIRIYRHLMEQFPDNADFGMRLAAVQVNAGAPKDALATLDRLRKLPVPVADEAAIEFVKSQAEEKSGDFERAQAAAAEAAVMAHGLEAQVLEADARAMECRQLVQLGRLDHAVTACQSAQTIYARTGNRLGLAASMAYLAAAYCNQGNIGEARSLYTQALDINREIGNARSDAQWALNGLAVLLLRQGDPSQARKLYEESLGMARKVGSRPDEVNGLSNIASTWLIEGDLQRARDLFEEALKRSRSMDARATTASLLNNLGHTLYLAGDLEAAAQALDEAVAADRETGAKLELADAHSSLGRVRLAQARTEDARSQFDESVRAAGLISSKVIEAQYRLTQAELELALGHSAAAEGPIRGCLEALSRAKLPGPELEARILLMRALLDEGKLEDARQEETRARGLAGASRNRATSMAFSIVAARTASSTGKPADIDRAVRELQAVAADAARQGFIGYQLDARLALGEIEAKNGRGAAARSMLEKLQQDARANSFEMIARKAAGALQKL